MKLKEIAEKHGLTPEGVDYALTQYQIVMCEITHGMMSKLSYDAKDIIQVAQERWCDTCDLKELESVEPAKFQAQTGSGWISIKDRMPVEKENPLTHDFEEVICFCDFGGLPRQTDIRMYKFGKPSWETKPHFWHGPQNMDGIVTHWMPLPEPPKEGDE